MNDWRPTASIAALRQRATLLREARQYFAERDVLEVETPIMGQYPTTDVFIESLRTNAAAGGGGWLRTSPEHHMKRLLAAGAPDIYQIGKVFRAGEQGSRHEPEFTMAEWYRHGFDLNAMIADTCEFIRVISAAIDKTISTPQIHSYSELFREATGCVVEDADVQRLRDIAVTAPGHTAELSRHLGDDRSAWLDFVASHLLYPALPRDSLQVIRDFPADQAMLAQLKTSDPSVAERFEVFYNGIELANGFRELRDANEQRMRFKRDNDRRRANQLPEMPVDELLLAALSEGLPDCSGVAVGLDRVLLIALGNENIAATLSFHSNH